MLLLKGLLTDEDLRRALRVHDETGRPLGEILVEHGAISTTALADVLLLQHAWRPLGQMLVDREVLTEYELSDALLEQERTGRPLGEIVRTKYDVSPAVIGDVLAEQRQLELEMDRGFGSGLRRGIDRRQRRSHGGSDDPVEHELQGPLGPRLESRRGGDDTLAVPPGALPDGEAAISTRGVASHESKDEAAALRAQVAEQARVIDELRGRLAELERATRANDAASPP